MAVIVNNRIDSAYLFAAGPVRRGWNNGYFVGDSYVQAAEIQAS
jgi:hypothetical protein